MLLDEVFDANVDKNRKRSAKRCEVSKGLNDIKTKSAKKAISLEKLTEPKSVSKSNKTFSNSAEYTHFYLSDIFLILKLVF